MKILSVETVKNLLKGTTCDSCAYVGIIRSSVYSKENSYVCDYNDPYSNPTITSLDSCCMHYRKQEPEPDWDFLDNLPDGYRKW
jgi:hypothetical protein